MVRLWYLFIWGVRMGKWGNWGGGGGREDSKIYETKQKPKINTSAYSGGGGGDLEILRVNRFTDDKSKNINIYPGFIEKFSLLCERWEALVIDTRKNTPSLQWPISLAWSMANSIRASLSPATFWRHDDWGGVKIKINQLYGWTFAQGWRWKTNNHYHYHKPTFGWHTVFHKR